jgi:hypothetical protein
MTKKLLSLQYENLGFIETECSRRQRVISMAVKDSCLEEAFVKLAPFEARLLASRLIELADKIDKEGA